MKTYRVMCQHQVRGWYAQEVSHPASEHVPAHYHEVEEWLEVLNGEVTFVSAGQHEYKVDQHAALRIPRGEVHSVRIGPQGVTYRMWTPVRIESALFSKQLDEDVMRLVETNLKVPTVENISMVGGENQEEFEKFFNVFLDEHLLFRTAKGSILDKTMYMKRDRGLPDRRPSDAICVIDKQEETVLVTTTVFAGAPTRSYQNCRLFVRRDDGWRCRVWINHSDPMAKDDVVMHALS